MVKKHLYQMILSNHLITSVIRTIAIAIFAVGIAQILLTALRSITTPWHRRLLIIIYWLPFLTPLLLIGYSYSMLGLSLANHPWQLQLLYSTIHIARLCGPLATLFYLFPMGMSSEAKHCYYLLKPQQSIVQRIQFHIKHTANIHLFSSLVCFILIFNEMELAALLSFDNCWSVKLFFAQVGGSTTLATIKQSILPLLLQIFMLILGIITIKKTANLKLLRTSQTGNKNKLTIIIATIIAISATIFILAYPLSFILQSSQNLFINFSNKLPYLHSIFNSIFFATSSALMASWLASKIVNATMRSSQKSKTWLLLLLPGLCGNLLLGLILSWLFQLPILNTLSTTVIPLLLGLTLYGLPFAFLVALLHHYIQKNSAIFLAKLPKKANHRKLTFRSEKLLWHYHNRGHFLGIIFIFWLLYMEVTISDLLKPLTWQPIAPELYNMMHYGQLPTYSSLLLLAITTPIILMVIGFIIIKIGYWMMLIIKNKIGDK